MKLPGQLRRRLQDRRAVQAADRPRGQGLPGQDRKNFETVFNTLKKYRTKNGGFVTYDKLTEGDRKILSARVNTLAEDLSKLRGMFGLN